MEISKRFNRYKIYVADTGETHYQVDYVRCRAVLDAPSRYESEKCQHPQCAMMELTEVILNQCLKS